MKRIIWQSALATMIILGSSKAWAGVTISPYVSIKSTKSVTPGKKSSGTENETLKQRQEYGIQASVSFWKLFKTQLSVGQSVLTTTSKVSAAKDEYGKIDFAQDLNMDTDQPDNEVKIKETQRVGKFSLLVDPSFSIFILRFKLGITAMQRIIEKDEMGREPTSITVGPKYNPHSGFGAGIRFSPRMYFMAEYNFLHYNYPTEIEPFERELSVSYNVSI
ncbi:MAG TPA: hypothetical protein VFO10_26050 [Oligoflexus sp.]|uniref:hypothetical protein n=1 Tax=Oligoflexus sp. TaxID=1971216 RepID=UPI002D7F5DE5|nr:hypothetical protein [Oligoflexus sp.]HET9240754.1 hypothetical protein [Oligoflexus sp.]